MTEEIGTARADQDGLTQFSPPTYGDPTGEQAIRNILNGTDWAAHPDWKLVGPARKSGERITVLLDPQLALAMLRLLQQQAEVKSTRRGQNIRARFKRRPRHHSVATTPPCNTIEGAP